MHALLVKPASLWRRLGAIFYDGLLAFALLALVTLPFIAARAGEAVDPGFLPYQLILLATMFLFFVGFWSGYGRTLGMQSWRLRIELPGGGRPGLAAASLRFFAAILSWLPLGLGFWWSLCDSEGLAWHDRLSGTRLIHYPKNKGSEP